MCRRCRASPKSARFVRLCVVVILSTVVIRRFFQFEVAVFSSSSPSFGIVHVFCLSLDCNKRVSTVPSISPLFFASRHALLIFLYDLILITITIIVKMTVRTFCYLRFNRTVQLLLISTLASLDGLMFTETFRPHLHIYLSQMHSSSSNLPTDVLELYIFYIFSTWV